MGKGLFQSDVHVVLLTKSYLSRPWCLLEIWEASRANIPLLPVVITPVHGELGFNLDSAYNEIRALETWLDPAALAVVQEHLTGQGAASVADLETVLMRMLDRHASTDTILGWDPCASDRLMMAATRDLCERMAKMCGRPQLEWRPHTKALTGDRRLVEGSLSRSGRRGGGAHFELFISYH